MVLIMKTLEYVQFKGISRMSKIIRKFTRDDDSHSAVLDLEATDEKILIEQWPHKGGLKSWMDYNYFDGRGGHTKGTTYKVWGLDVSEKHYNYIMGFYRASAAAKKSYDWGGIFAFGLKGSGDPKETFCSEEMVTPLVLAFGWDHIKPEVVHPGYFRNLLQAAGAKILASGIV